MKLVATAAVTAMLLMGQSDSSPQRSVTAVRHWSLKDITRVAIEVSGPFEVRSDRLHSPERVYFDILNSHLHIPPKLYYTETVGDDLLAKIRVAETTPGITRVVLDLTGDATTSTSTLTNPDRLIIELRRAAGNPLRTETFSAVDHVKTPVPVATPAPVLPPPPTIAAVAKPAPAATRTAGDLKVPGISLEGSKPPAPIETAAPTAPLEEFHPAIGDPGPPEIARAARHNSDGTNSLIRALGLKLNRVVIDPGHGGHDQGTEGTKGLLEKDLVLDVALRVGKLVQDGLGAEVIYTRSDDTFIPLEGRTALANEKKADLFLSIHANSSPYPNISGVETYYLNINGSKDALDVRRAKTVPRRIPYSIYRTSSRRSRCTISPRSRTNSPSGWKLRSSRST